MYTIKKKLLLLFLFSMSGSMLIAGLVLTFIFKNNYEESVKTDFNNYYERAINAFKQIELDTQYYSDELAKRPSIINPINLISEYSDITNYQANIYNEEKKNIARILYSYGKTSQLIEIRAYDKNGWLTAFSRPNTISGIVSFVKGNPIVFITEGNSEKWEVASDSVLIPALKSTNRELIKNSYISIGDAVGNETVSDVIRIYRDGQKKNIGKLYVINPITESTLNTLSEGSQGQHGILLPDDKWVGKKVKGVNSLKLKSTHFLFDKEKNNKSEWIGNDEYFVNAFSIPLLNGNNFYLVSGLDKTVIDNRVREIVYVIFIVFIVSIIILLPMVILFSRHSITLPLDNLVSTVNSLQEGEHKTFDPGEHSSYEINELAVAFNNAANKVIEREKELRAAHNQLEQRVEERTKELVVSNDKLKKENKERVIAENNLKETSQMIMTVIESIPQNVFWKDKDSVYLGCNKNFSVVAGLNHPDDIIGKNDYDLPWKKSESDSYVADDRRVMLENKAEYNIHETITVNEKEVHVETNKVPLHDFNGNVIGILGTYQDITLRINFENEIMAAKEAAEKANNAKSDFLSHMSHELRTPLNAILGFAQLLEMDVSASEEQKKSNINEIISAGNHLLILINEVLDLAKIESSEIDLEIENVNAFDILNESLKLTKSLAESKNINIEVEISDCKQIMVEADATRLKQIFINFITNAIKYNKDNGKVVINCESAVGSGIQFNIIDTGIGIEEENIKKIFVPFERLGIEDEAIDGTGIGLVICKRLIELMNGTFGVESKVGEGSKFWFTLPSAVI